MAFLAPVVKSWWRFAMPKREEGFIRLASSAHASQSSPKTDGDENESTFIATTDERFQRGSSVDFWECFNSSSPDALRKLVADLVSDIRQDSSALSYYSYCLGRSMFFAAQGLLSLEVRGFQTRKYFRASRNVSFSHHFAEAGYAFRQDYQNIRQGIYKRPWDMSVRHRQANPLFVGINMARYLHEAQATLSRRASEEDAADVWMDSVSFPAYYKKPFHFQGDGWMSSRSADVYDASTETLFIGRQDAMQRLALVAVSDYIQQIDRDKKFKLLEIGAGTGRVATFILDNFPNVEYIVNDLSPFYLQKARENIKYWEKFRRIKEGQRLVTYLQAPAESTPLPAESVSFVLAVYLFHELPPDVRRATAKEISRLLEPGGMFALVDSIQFGDRTPKNERIVASLEGYGNFAEPWYASFVEEDFGKMFEDVGLVPHRKEISSVTKLLTFMKPV